MGKKPVVIKDNAADGNCFFSAVWHALKERPGLLEKVSEITHISVDNEKAFIQAFRNKIAEEYLSGAGEEFLQKARQTTTSFSALKNTRST